jgi:hypothetical protein
MRILLAKASDLYAPTSNSCISTSIENWTHVYMNLFTRNSPYLYLLKYLLFLLKHPVYNEPTNALFRWFINILQMGLLHINKLSERSICWPIVYKQKPNSVLEIRVNNFSKTCQQLLFHLPQNSVFVPPHTLLSFICTVPLFAPVLCPCMLWFSDTASLFDNAA